MNLQEYCSKYIANLRALYLLHQNHHWLTFGPNFYGNHQLFERLYKSAQENADLAAEKLIGNFGMHALGVKEQPKLIGDLLVTYNAKNAEDMTAQSLKAELDFLKFSQEFYDILANENKLSLGLDDAIMSIANTREESVYLLKQLLGENMNKLSMLANKFSKKLAQVSTDINADQFSNSVRNMLNVYLGNKNWGEVGFNGLNVAAKQDEQQGKYLVLRYNIIVPANSPPFVDKKKYPGGLNQFKQEVMSKVSEIANQQNIGNLVQIITVNDQ